MHRRLRVIVPVVAILALGSFAIFREPARTPAPAPVSVSAPTHTPAPQEKPIQNAVDSATAEKPITQKKTAEKTLEKPAETNFTLEIGTRKYPLSVPFHTSVYAAMNLLAAKDPAFIFNAKEYPGLGYFIESIGEVKNDSGAYWTLYINGTMSTVGAAQYEVKQGDSITWKFEKLGN